MRSTPWLTMIAVLAMALVTTLACTKDAESKEAFPATPAAQAAEKTGKVANLEGSAQAPAKSTAAPKGSIDLADLNAKGDVVAAGQNVGGDSSYAVTLDAPSSVAKGTEGTVQVTVVPKTGWKMNKEFPTKLKVVAPEGVTVTKDTQSVADAVRFDDKGATFAIKFKSDTAGQKSFTADFKFAVCTDATCDPKKQALAWAVDVK